MNGHCSDSQQNFDSNDVPSTSGTQFLNGNAVAAVVLSDDDDIIIEDEKVLSEEDQIELKCNRIDQMLSWFLKMKAELYDKFLINGKEYIKESISEQLVVDIQTARKVLDEYQATGSIDDMFTKFNLSSDALIIVAICMATLDENNSRNINFDPLCYDRLDSWSYNVLDLFMNDRRAGTEKESNRGPLELAQQMHSPPDRAVLGLTILWLRLNDFPCRLEFKQHPKADVTAEELLNFEISLGEKALSMFQENLRIVDESAKLPKEAEQVVEEIVRTHAMFAVDAEKFRHAVSEILKLKEHLHHEDPVEEVTDADFALLTEEERKCINETMANFAETNLLVEAFTKQVEEQKNSAKRLYEGLTMWPGDFCLARKEPCDLAEFHLAVVEDQINATTYRVTFLKEPETMSVNIRDLADPKFTMVDPIVVETNYIGLRVACVVTKTDPKTKKPYNGWYSGTVGGRPALNGNDYLVFLDDMEDIYVRAPSKIDTLDLSFNALSKCDTPENTENRLNLIRIVPIIQQPFDEHGEMSLPRVAQLVREKHKNRRKFLMNFMLKYPEWPLLRVKIGSSLNVTDIVAKGTRLMNVVSTDRAFCVVRATEKPGTPGYGCLEYKCENKLHSHKDERLYRGSYKIPAVEVDRSDDNNLSKRSRDRIRRQFDHGDRQKEMPTMESISEKNASGDKNQGNRGGAARKENQISDKEVAGRKAKQNYYNKTKVLTPVLKPLKEMKYHASCGSGCIEELDADPYDRKFHKCSPLHTPLMCGWRRMKIVALTARKRQVRSILYYSPCGKALSTFNAIHQYLRDTSSLLTIDCFSFDVEVDTETYVTCDPEYIKKADYADGIEGVPIPAVNCVDDDEPPKIEYSSRRFQYDETVDISTINRGFCSGCSCEGDCSDSTKCECQLLTMDSYSRMPRKLMSEYRKFNGLYRNKNLLDKVPGGIYECNDNCSCQRKTCHNRVVQENIKWPMQLFKTAESGWGVRALVDIPKGAFVCNYVGALLTDNIADSMKFEDQYFADLDLKDYVERQKLIDEADEEGDYGFEDDDTVDTSNESDEGEENEEDEDYSNDGVARRRSARQMEKKKKKVIKKKQMKNERKKRKNEELFKWDKYFEGGSPLFVVDAKYRGNIGRFFNHSCEPNLHVQHVLYDTHDLRLPWAAFFTTQLIKAGQEMCWDYNYEVDEDEEEYRISCRCGSKNCRGKLL